MNGQSVICKHNYPDQNCCPRCEIDRLTAQLAEAKTSIAKQVEAKDKACAALMNQLAEAKASAEAWQENCRLTEDELEKERNKHADTIAKLAERDGAITCYNEVLAELREENAALHEEVGRLKSQPVGYYDTTQIVAETRKQAAQEIIQYIQSGLRRGTVYYVDDTDLKDIKQRYGLEG